MKSLLSGTRNTRFVLKDSTRFLRSDAPCRLSDADCDFLLAHDIRTVIDLRTPAELAKKPCPLAQDTRFTYLHLPVTGGDGIPASPDEVAESYIRMADGQMRHILSVVLHSPTGVLFFCGAGKDRTGVLAAMLQKHFGVPEEEIVRGYTASGELLKDLLEAYAAAGTDIRVITPQPVYMERFLAWYDREGK